MCGEPAAIFRPLHSYTQTSLLLIFRSLTPYVPEPAANLLVPSLLYRSSPKLFSVCLIRRQVARARLPDAASAAYDGWGSRRSSTTRLSPDDAVERVSRQRVARICATKRQEMFFTMCGSPRARAQRGATMPLQC